METLKGSRPRFVLGTLLLILVGTGCPPRYEEPAPTKAAGFDTSLVDTVSVASMAAYGARLSYDTVVGAADVQPLLIRNGVRYGFAKVEPERGAYRLDTNDLARGRIIGRVSSESAYAPLGLGRGINWWWVDRKGGKWRSAIYSETLNAKSVVVLDSVKSHPGYHWQQSIARIVLFDSTAALWGYTDSKCIPKFLPGMLPAWYWQMDRAHPWGALRPPP
jgi:hypothetical protein